MTLIYKANEGPTASCSHCGEPYYQHTPILASIPLPLASTAPPLSSQHMVGPGVSLFPAWTPPTSSNQGSTNDRRQEAAIRHRPSSSLVSRQGVATSPFAPLPVMSLPTTNSRRRQSGSGSGSTGRTGRQGRGAGRQDFRFQVVIHPEPVSLAFSTSTTGDI